ncbi:MAG: group II intron reverse transcriptase/maturase [Planctomycetales bacterium]|nr:group II intron reverse transcriptase/maturase [Planctomycetales bacterium]
MNQTTEPNPATVPTTAKQAGEIRARWAWVEPSIWTDRMLTALEQGVKGGIWYSLIDKAYAPANLFASYAKVAANDGAAGVDHVTIEDFTKRLSRNLEKLAAQLKDDEYRPQNVRRVNIPKPGTKETRPLGIPTVRDRVVQGALRHVLEPIFERQFAEHSYGFRPGRGCKDALRRVDKLLKQGCRYVVDVDLKSYFDTIPHDKLLDEVRKYVADNRVLALIEAFLKAEIFDGMRQWTPESGAPQGAVLSPLLSNLYLNELDHHMARSGYEMTRYADDLVIQCRSREEAERALSLVQAWTAQRGLTLHPTKTKIVDAAIDGFDFLGYRFVKHRRFPRRKSLAKFKDAIRAKSRRTAGRSLSMIVADVNRTLRGWFEYFQHSHRRTFPELDGWVRMRLRSILRKRQGGSGRGRGTDHQRWPNAYFTEQGLFNLTAAHVLVSQSSRR